ncbi:hypothetical protein BASA81_006836 [Batrachochytrium salamandrivorans]|nr:hypothetical protein BASA81_006836 [Batrachochytrium salamandrivorans]
MPTSPRFLWVVWVALQCYVAVAGNFNCSEIHLQQYSTPKDCPNCTYVLLEDGLPFCREISVCDVPLNYSLARPYGCPDICQLEIKNITGEEYCAEISLDEYLVNLYWGRNGNLPYGFLFWNVLTVVCVFLFVQYVPLLLGFLTTWVVNHLLLQPKTEFFHLRGVTLMLIGGRATLTGIEYLSPNVHVKCVELSVNVKWWRGSGEIRQAPNNPSVPAATGVAAASAKPLPFRMSFFFTGLEISVFNNSPRYDLVEGYVLKAIYRTVFSKEPPSSPPSHDSNETAKIVQGEQGDGTNDNDDEEGGLPRPPNFSPAAANAAANAACTVEPRPRFYNLFPITRVQCRNVALYVGAPTLPTTLIVHIQRAVGLHFSEPIGPESANYGLDSYRTVNKFDFRGVVVSSKPNSGFVASDEVNVLRQRMDNKNNMDANGFFHEIVRNLRSGLNDVKIGMKDVRTDWEKTLGQTLAGAGGGGNVNATQANQADPTSPSHHQEEEEEGQVSTGTGIANPEAPVSPRFARKQVNFHTSKRMEDVDYSMSTGFVLDPAHIAATTTADEHREEEEAEEGRREEHGNRRSLEREYYAASEDGEDGSARKPWFFQRFFPGRARNANRRVLASSSFEEENGTFLRRQQPPPTPSTPAATSAAKLGAFKPKQWEEPNLLKTGKIELFVHTDQPGKVGVTEMERFQVGNMMLPPPRQSLTFYLGGGGAAAEEEEVMIAYGPWADRQRALFMEHFFPYLSEDQVAYVPKLGQRREALAVDIKVNFIRLGELRFLYREQDLGLLMTDSTGGTREHRGLWYEVQQSLEEMMLAQQSSDVAEEKAERARQQKLQRLRASEAQIKRNEDQSELPGKLALREIEKDAWLLCDKLDVDIFLKHCSFTDEVDLALLADTFNAMSRFQRSICDAMPYLNPSLFPVSEYLAWSTLDKARWLWGEFSGRESCMFPPPPPSYSEEPVPAAISELRQSWEALRIPPFLWHLAPSNGGNDLLKLCALEMDESKRAELEVLASDPRSRLSRWYDFASEAAAAAAAASSASSQPGLHSRHASGPAVVAPPARSSEGNSGHAYSNQMLPPPFDSYSGPVSNAYSWNTTCGYLDILVQPGSLVQVTMALYPLVHENGCSTVVNIEFKKPRVSCSATRSVIAEASSAHLSASVFYPLVWNDTQQYRVDAQLYSPIFKFLKADLQALGDLAKDWTSNAAEPLSADFFVPVTYQVAVRYSNCELRFNVNESNVVDLPDETADFNTFCSLVVPTGTLNVAMNQLEYKPRSSRLELGWEWNSDSILGLPIRCNLVLPVHHPKRSIPVANKVNNGSGGSPNTAIAMSGSMVFLEISQVKSTIEYEYFSPPAVMGGGDLNVDVLDMDLELDACRFTAYPEAVLALSRFQENYLGANVCFISKDLFRAFGGENFKTLLAYRMWSDRESGCRKVVENEFESRVRGTFTNSLVFLPTELYPRLTSEGALMHPEEDAITLFSREIVVEMRGWGESAVEYSIDVHPIRIQIPNIEKKSISKARGDHLRHGTDAFARLFQQTGNPLGGSGFRHRDHSAAYAGSSNNGGGGGGEVGQLVIDGLRAELCSTFGRVSKDALAPSVAYRNTAKCTLGAIWGDLEIHQMAQVYDAAVVFELMLTRSKSFDFTNGGTRDASLCSALPIGHLDRLERKLALLAAVSGDGSTSAPASLFRTDQSRFPLNDHNEDNHWEEDDEDEASVYPRWGSFGESEVAAPNIAFTSSTVGQGGGGGGDVTMEDFAMHCPQEDPLTICFSVELHRISNLPRGLEKRSQLSVQMVYGGQGYVSPVPASILRPSTTSANSDLATKEGYCFLSGVGGNGSDVCDLKISLLDTSCGGKRAAGEVRFPAQEMRMLVADFRRSAVSSHSVQTVEGTYALDAQNCHRSFRQFSCPMSRASLQRQFPQLVLNAHAPEVVFPANLYSTSKTAGMRITVRLFAVRGTVPQIESLQSERIKPRRIERVFDTASLRWGLTFGVAQPASRSTSSLWLSPRNVSTGGEDAEKLVRKPRDLELDPRLLSAREWRRQFVANATTHIMQFQAMNHVAQVYAHNTASLAVGSIALCTWANAWDSVIEWRLGEFKLLADFLCNEQYAWKVSSSSQPMETGLPKADCIQLEVKHLKRSGEEWSLIGRASLGFDPRMFGTRGESGLVEQQKQAKFIDAHDLLNKMRRAKESSLEANRGFVFVNPTMALVVGRMPKVCHPLGRPVSIPPVPPEHASFSLHSAKSSYSNDDFMSALGSLDLFQDCEGEQVFVEDVDEEEISDTSSFASFSREGEGDDNGERAVKVFVSSRKLATLPFERPMDCASCTSLDPFLCKYAVSRHLELNDFWLGKVAGISALNSSSHQKRELGIAPNAKTSIQAASSSAIPITLFSGEDSASQAWIKFPVLWRRFTPVVPDSLGASLDGTTGAGEDARGGGGSGLDTISLRLHLSEMGEVFVTPPCVVFLEDALHLWFPSSPSVAKMTDFFERNYLVVAPRAPPRNRLAERSLKTNALFSCAKGLSLHLVHGSKWTTQPPSSSSEAPSQRPGSAKPSTTAAAAELVYSSRLSCGALTVALRSLYETKSKSRGVVINVGNICFVIQLASAFDLLHPSIEYGCFPVVRISVSDALLIQNVQEVQSALDSSNHLTAASTASFHGVELVSGVDSLYATYSVALTWGDLVSSLWIESAAIWHRKRRQWAVLAGQVFALAKRIDENADGPELGSDGGAGDVPKLASALLLWCKTEIPFVSSSSHHHRAETEVPLVGHSTLVRTRRIICFLAENLGTEERMMDVAVDRHFFANPVMSLETFSGAKGLFPSFFTAPASSASFGSMDLGDQAFCRRLVIELLRGVANRVVVRKRPLTSSTKSFEFRLEGMVMRVLDTNQKEELKLGRHHQHGPVPMMPMLRANSLCMFVHIRPIHLVVIQHNTRRTSSILAGGGGGGGDGGRRGGGFRDRRASDIQLTRRLVPTDVKETVRATCAGIDMTAAPELILASRAGATVLAHYQDLVLYREHERKVAFQTLKREKDALEHATASAVPSRKKEPASKANWGGPTAVATAGAMGGGQVVANAGWEALQTPRRKDSGVFFTNTPEVPSYRLPDTQSHPVTAATSMNAPRKGSITEDTKHKAQRFTSEREPATTPHNRRIQRGSFAIMGEKFFGRGGGGQGNSEGLHEDVVPPAAASFSMYLDAPRAVSPPAAGGGYSSFRPQHPQQQSGPPAKRVVTRNTNVALNVRSCVFRFTSALLKEHEGKVVEDKSTLVTLALDGYRVAWTQILSSAPASSQAIPRFRDFGLFLIRGLKLTVEGDGKISKRGVAWRIWGEMENVILNVVRGDGGGGSGNLETRILTNSAHSKCQVPLYAIDNENFNQYVDRWVNAFRLASEHAEMMRLGNLLEWERRGASQSVDGVGAGGGNGEESQEDSLSRSLFALGLPTLAREFSSQQEPEEDFVNGELAWMNPFGDGDEAGGNPEALPASSSFAIPAASANTTTANSAKTAGQRRSASRGAAAQQQFDYVKENASALLRVVFTLRMHDLDIAIFPSEFAKFKWAVSQVTVALDRRSREMTSVLCYFSPSTLQFDKRDNKKSSVVVDFSQSLPSSWLIGKSTSRYQSALSKAVTVTTKGVGKRPSGASASSSTPRAPRGMIVSRSVTMLMEASKHSFTPGIFHQLLALQSGLSSEISVLVDSAAKFSGVGQKPTTASFSSLPSSSPSSLMAIPTQYESEYLFYLEGVSVRALANNGNALPSQLWSELETQGLELRVTQLAAPRQQAVFNFSAHVRHLKLALLAGSSNEDVVHLIRLLCNMDICNREEDFADVMCITMDQNSVVIRPLFWIKFSRWLAQYSRAFHETDGVDRYAKQVWNSVKHGPAVASSSSSAAALPALGGRQIQSIRFVVTNSSLLTPFVDHRKRLSAVVATLERLEVLAKSELVYESAAQDGNRPKVQFLSSTAAAEGKKPRRHSATAATTQALPPTAAEFRKGLFVRRNKYVALVECVNVDVSYVADGAEKLLPLRFVSSVVHHTNVGDPTSRRRCSVEFPSQSMSVVGEEVSGKTDWNLVLTIAGPKARCDRTLSQCLSGLQHTWGDSALLSNKVRKRHETILRDPTDSTSWLLLDGDSATREVFYDNSRNGDDDDDNGGEGHGEQEDDASGEGFFSPTGAEERRFPLPRTSSLPSLLAVHLVDFNLKLESGELLLFAGNHQLLQRKSSIAGKAAAAAAVAAAAVAASKSPSMDENAELAKPVVRGPRQAMMEAQRAAVRTGTDQPSLRDKVRTFSSSSFSKKLPPLSSPSHKKAEETFLVDLPAVSFSSIYETDMESHDVRGNLVVGVKPLSLSPALFAFLEDVVMGAKSPRAAAVDHASEALRSPSARRPLFPPSPPSLPAPPISSPIFSSKTKIKLMARLTPLELNLKRTQEQITSSLKLKLDSGMDLMWTFGPASEQMKRKSASYVSISLPSLALVLHEAHPALELLVRNTKIALHQVDEVFGTDPMFTGVVFVETVHSQCSLWRIESFFALQREWEEAWEEIAEERRNSGGPPVATATTATAEQNQPQSHRYSSNLKRFDQMVQSVRMATGAPAVPGMAMPASARSSLGVKKQFFPTNGEGEIGDGGKGVARGGGNGGGGTEEESSPLLLIWNRSRVAFLSLRVSSVVSEMQLGVLASNVVVKVNKVSCRLTLAGQVQGPKRNPDPDLFHLLIQSVEVESTGAYEGVLEWKHGLGLFYARERPSQHNALLRQQLNHHNTLNRLMFHCPTTSLSFSRVFTSAENESVGNRTILVHVALAAVELEVKDEVWEEERRIQRHVLCVVDSALVHLSVSAAPILFDAMERLGEEIRLAKRGYERAPVDVGQAEEKEEKKATPKPPLAFLGSVTTRVHHADLSLVHDASSTVWGTTVSHLGARMSCKAKDGVEHRTTTLVFAEVDIFRYPGKGSLLVSSIMARSHQKPEHGSSVNAAPAAPGSTGTDESEEDLFAVTPPQAASPAAAAGMVSQTDAARRATEARRERVQAANQVAKKQGKRNIVHVPKSTITMTTFAFLNKPDTITYKFLSEFADVITVSTDQREYAKLREILAQMRFTSNRVSTPPQAANALATAADLRVFVQHADPDSFVFSPQLNIMGEATQKVMDWFLEQNMRVKRTDLPKQFYLVVAQSFERAGSAAGLGSSTVNGLFEQMASQ